MKEMIEIFNKMIDITIMIEMKNKVNKIEMKDIVNKIVNMIEMRV